MLTVTIEKRVHPARLHEALVAAGIRVVKVRAGGERAEVVLEDGQDPAAVTTLAAQHDPDSNPENEQALAALAILDDPTKPDKQRLNVACEVVSRLLRQYLKTLR